MTLNLVKGKTFTFKQFTIVQTSSGMKLTTDAVLLGAWCAQLLTERPTLGQHILDIGTGTGILSLILAQFTSATIEAVEIDKFASLDALHNFQHSPFTQRIALYEQDIASFAGNESKAHRYDFIICNPPYFTSSIACKNPMRTAARCSASLPATTLFACVQKLLVPQGLFAMLIPTVRVAEYLAIATQMNLVCWGKEEFCGKEGKDPYLAILVFQQATTCNVPCSTTKTHYLYTADGARSAYFSQLTAQLYLPKKNKQ